MRSIQATPAARILRISRIHRGNGTRTHSRGLRDARTRGNRGREPAHTTLRHPDPGSGKCANAARIVGHLDPKSGAHLLCRHPACPPAAHQGGGGLMSGAAPGARQRDRTATMEHRAGQDRNDGTSSRLGRGLRPAWTGLRRPAGRMGPTGFGPSARQGRGHTRPIWETWSPEDDGQPIPQRHHRPGN